MLANLYIVATL